jgi:hypothetical protein
MRRRAYKYLTVTDLLKALLGDGFVNTFQHATMGAVFSVDECYSSLPGSSQRANELAGWRSRANANRGVSTMEVVFCALVRAAAI